MLLKCLFGAITGATFGIIVFLAQAQFISAPAKFVKTRSIMVLFRLMSTQERREEKKKKKPRWYITKANMAWISRKYMTTIWPSQREGVRKRASWVPKAKTMAGGRLFFCERGNSNKQWLMGAWWAITAHRFQPRGASVRRGLTATTEFLFWLHYHGKY